MQMKRILAGLVTLLFALPGQAATRLAVVDVGTQEKMPAAFVDLLTIELGKQPALILLERTEIRRLFGEQSLGMALGGGDAVKAGKLWTVDAFLMVEAGKTGKQETPVRVRLVDAHYGLKLLDASFLLSEKAAKYQESAELLADRTGGKLTLLSRGAEGLLMVSVAPIRSEEIAKRWDWLREPLSAGVEQNLGVLPGILLMERDRTRPLTDERQLTAGLPEALRASAVFVDGSFKINREKGPDIVTLQLRARRGGQTLATTALDGSITNTVELCRRSAKEIAAKLGVKPSENSMEAEREAAMLVAEAQTPGCLDGRALIEAALALVPDSCNYQKLLLATIPSNKSMDQFAAESLRGFSLAEAILRGCPAGATQYGEVSNFISNFLNVWSRVQRDDPDARHHEAFSDVSKGFWDLWRAYYKAAPRWRENAMSQGQRASSLCTTVDQAIEFARFDVTEAAARNPQNPVMGSFFVFEWLSDPVAQPKIIAFMDELMTSTNPAVRYLGLKWGILLYQRTRQQPGGKPDEARARAIAEERLALLKSQKYRSLDVWHTFASCRYSDDPKVDAEKHARIYQSLIDYGVKEGLFDATLAAKTADLLVRADRGQEAATFLENYLAIPPVWNPHRSGEKPELEGQLRDLRQRFPSKTAKQQNSPPVTVPARNLLTFKRQKSANSAVILWTGGRRIVTQGNTAAIVYYYSGEAGDGYGVIRFDTDKLQVISDQRAGKNAYVSPATGSDQSFWSGPAVAFDGRNVFVGHPTEGIIVFPADGQPRLLNEEKGLASQQIWSLAELDGKLYAVIGSPWVETGLMEVDWKSNTSRILFSERTKSPDLPLAGQGTFGILSDHKRRVLWLLSGTMNLNTHSGPVSLYAYHPRENRAELIQKDVLSGGAILMQWSKEQMLISRNSVCLSVNPEKKDITVICTTDQVPARKGATWRRPITNFAPRGLTFVGNDFYEIQDWELLWFRQGVTAPTYALDGVFPGQIAQKFRIRDLALTQHGLLVLSEDALYLVPEFTAPSPTGPAK